MTHNFQSRLKQVIEEKCISASELSRLSGVGKSDISNYLNGKYKPKQDKVYHLAKALNVDPGWLMTGVEQKIEPEPPASEDIRLLIRGLSKLSPEQVEQAKNVMKAMFVQYADYFDSEKENDE